ncbi:universal stress protein [Mycobacterium intermedium]|uniref:Universal stress protein n=1 Tax=Mycobacterium intermedium TaxID=28445 RepID=A0A1E3SCS6_MYCIE|nr:universal stress protein [Mycobacterium intermedium]MCV6966540.1 universal stress protein [Mycobacterium intermedium]ODQ99938.1 universal stress protein [Mycobacterium intermedium]OPE49786.1 universal stress protein [Mycobacterium intermedium]ORB08252.1 universal stress protein [Mycobacterium intermedium]
MSTAAKRYGIVVGVDGSAASDAALHWAARDAALRTLSLTLVHAVNLTPMWPAGPMPTGISVWREEDGRQVLERAQQLAEEVVPNDRHVEIKGQLIWSPPQPALLEISEGAEMVVVGSRGRGAVARGLLGSVSSGLARRAKCPVAVVREEDPAHPVPAQGPVVVGIDGSPASELATAIAFEEAARRGVELRAVHAWSDIDVSELADLDWSAFSEEAEQVLAERLAGWQERYPDVTVHRRVVRDRPARRLIKESESAQLVVVGSHGRGHVKGALLGSVSNAVLHSVHTPLVIARPT